MKILSILIISILSVVLTQQTNVNRIKALVKSHLFLTETLNEYLMINNISMKRKEIIIARLEKIKLELQNYANQSLRNTVILYKIWSQLVNESKTNELLEKKKIKEKSASDHINSITGFWG